MNEQMIILFFLIITFIATLFLYIWKAKKEYDYNKDERWQMIQIKANNAASYLNWVLIVLLSIGGTVPLFHDVQITFTFERVMTLGLLFIGFRNVLELFALLHFDKKM